MGRSEHSLVVKIAGDLAASFGTSMRTAEKELTALYNSNNRRNAGFVKGVENLSNVSDKAFNAIVKGTSLAGVGIAGITAASVKYGKDFEAQMSTVESISGATSAEMKLLTEMAEKMGRETKFSATESGQAMEYMAMAGWKTEQMIGGLPGIMNLAAASGEELGTVSDIVTDAMTAFGLKAEDTAMFADVLAQASSNSNTNVSMMGETFKYVAPVAGSFGYNVKDTALAIGLMANAGIKSSQAGTSLRKILLELGSGAKLTGKAFGKMNIETANADGSMRPLKDVLEDLRKGFALMTEEERAANAEAIAGKTGVAALLSIVNAGEDDFNKLTEAIENSEGAAERMSNIRIDNLAGDAVLLGSAIEGAGIRIYKGLADPLRELTQMAAAWVSSFTKSDWMEHFTTEGIPTARRNLIGLGESFAPLINAGKWFVKNPKIVSSSLAGIGGALLTFKAAKGFTNAVKAIGTLSGVMGAWPVLAAGTAIGSLIGIGTAIAQAEKEAARANLADHFGEIALSMKELEEVAHNIVGADLLDGIDLFRETQLKTEGIRKSLKDSLGEINKSEWRLKLGIDFTEDDTKSYITSVEQYVSDAQEYITSNGYELKMAVGIVMGDSEDGQQLSEGNDMFTQSLLTQVEPIKEKINEALTSITEEGLTLDKQKILDGYLQEMSELTSMITDAENAAQLQMIEGQYKGLGELTPETFQNLQQSINEYTDTALAGVDESYQKILVGLNARRIAGDLTEMEFDQESEEAMQQYFQRKAEAIQSGQRAMKDAVSEIYGQEINTALESLDTAISGEIARLELSGQQALDPFQWKEILDFSFNNVMNGMDISGDTKKAISMLMEGMQPGEESLQQLAEQYRNSGGDIGAEFYLGIMEAFNQSKTLEAVTGSEGEIWAALGAGIADSPALAAVLSAVEQNSALIPDELINTIHEKIPDAEAAGRDLLQDIKEEMEGLGIDTTIPVRVTLDMATAHIDTSGLYIPPGALSGIGIGKRAKGGHVTSPEISWIAEAGYPETVIPHDGSQRSVDLWRETGRMIGAYETNNYSKINAQFDNALEIGQANGTGNQVLPSVQINQNIYADVSEETLEKSNQNLIELFERWYEDKLRQQARVAF